MRRICLVVLPVLAVAALALGLAGCKKESSTSSPGPAAAGAPVGESVNSMCPIMGGPIPKPIPADLTRQYKGKTVGFCCSACPGQWDNLTDAQKDATLAKVMTTPATPTSKESHELH